MKNCAREAQVKEAFGTRVFEKGRNYFKEGRVVEIIVDGDMISGKVMGSMHAPYRATLNWGDGISSACSCPVSNMCKHGAALALAYLSDAAGAVDLVDVREEIQRLDEEETKRLLAECMAREPRLIRLLRADDGPRVKKMLNRMERSFSGGPYSSPMVPRDELSLEIEAARRWRGSEADGDRVELAIQGLEMLIDQVRNGWDEHDEEGVYDASASLADLLSDSLNAIPERDLVGMLERLLDLEEKDEYDIGADAMMEIVAGRIGPEGLVRLHEQDNSGGRRGKIIKELAVEALRRSGDPGRAAGIMAGNGASPQELLFAAEMLIEGGNLQRAKDLLSERELDRGDLRMASLLLKAGGVMSARDVDVKGLLSSLDRTASSRSMEKDADEVLRVLGSIMDDRGLLGSVREMLPVGPAKLILLAKLGEDNEMEAMYLQNAERYRPIAWALAVASGDPRVAGRISLRAASLSADRMGPREEDALRSAMMECSTDELEQLFRFTTRDQDLTIRVFGYLAERSPAMARDFLVERFREVDPEHVIRAVDGLGRHGRKDAVDLGMTWVRRKLDGSPRYDRIRAMLLKVKDTTGPEEWTVQKDALRREYADRKKLLEVLDRIG